MASHTNIWDPLFKWRHTSDDFILSNNDKLFVFLFPCAFPLSVQREKKKPPPTRDHITTWCFRIVPFYLIPLANLGMGHVMRGLPCFLILLFHLASIDLKIKLAKPWRYSKLLRYRNRVYTIFSPLVQAQWWNFKLSTRFLFQLGNIVEGFLRYNRYLSNNNWKRFCANWILMMSLIILARPRSNYHEITSQQPFCSVCHLGSYSLHS